MNTMTRFQAPASRYRRGLGVAAAMVCLGMMTSLAAAYFVSVEFVGGAPISTYQSWAWGEGTPLPNAEVERAMRKAVEEQLAAKGYAKIEGRPDFWMIIRGAKDEMMSSGQVRVEALDAAGENVIWRGKIDGFVQTESPSKRAKLGTRAVKKMFKKFPDKS